MTAAPFAPTHAVPAMGTRAWVGPDGTGPAAALLDPGLEVRVVERRGDWAHVACSNGWQGWVDGRQLDAWLPESQRRSPTMTVRGLSIASLIGGIAIAVGSFLDWWSLGALGINAWDIPAKYLFAGEVGDGFDVGPILAVLAAVLAVSLVRARRLPSIVLTVVAALGVGIAAAAAIRGLRNDPVVYPEIGLIVTAVGAALVATDGLGFWSRRS
jgi:hypothetical protein